MLGAVITRRIEDVSSWMLLAPGNRAMLRFPADSMPQGGVLASCVDVLTANCGKPFPWGAFPDSSRAAPIWKKHRVGFGGLIHDKWFVTKDGRVGGAPNVPEQLPGSLRSCMFLDGGSSSELADNEGYAVVKEVSIKDRQMYRLVQLHAAEHVVADGGGIIVSPIGPQNEVYVGFIGRCQSCPNPELISFRQLKAAVPGYVFKLLPEWENWQL